MEVTSGLLVLWGPGDQRGPSVKSRDDSAVTEPSAESGVWIHPYRVRLSRAARCTSTRLEELPSVGTWVYILVDIYMPYEGSNLAHQKSRKLVVFDRKLEGSHSPYYSYFAKYKRVMMC